MTYPETDEHRRAVVDRVACELADRGMYLRCRYPETKAVEPSKTFRRYTDAELLELYPPAPKQAQAAE